MGNDMFAMMVLPTCLVGAWGMALGLGPVVLQYFDRLLIDGVEHFEDGDRTDEVGDAARRDDLTRLGLCGPPTGGERRDEMGFLSGPSVAVTGMRPWM